MQVAQGALRHGALYDLLDREHSETDIRSTTVQRLAAKFEVDAAQAQRVGRVACAAAAPAARGRQRRGAGAPRAQAWLGRAAARDRQPASRTATTTSTAPTSWTTPTRPASRMTELHRLSLLVLGHRGKLRKLEADYLDDELLRPPAAVPAAGGRPLPRAARSRPEGPAVAGRRPRGHAGGAARVGQGLSAVGSPAARGSRRPGRRRPGPWR